MLGQQEIVLTSVEQYCSEVFRLPRLTDSQERELEGLARLGDTEARTKLIRSFQPRRWKPHACSLLITLHIPYSSPWCLWNLDPYSVQRGSLNIRFTPSLNCHHESSILGTRKKALNKKDSLCQAFLRPM